MILLRLLLVTIIATLVLAGCGSGGGDGDDGTGLPDATATPTADAFDPRVYTQFVLRPEDVPPGLLFDDAFAPNGASFTTVYLDPNTRQQLIQSTVARIADPVQREATFTRLRRVYAGFFVEGEENYDPPIGDQAFMYTLFQPPAIAANILRGEFIIYIQLNAYPGPPLKSDLDRYAGVVLSRVDKYIQDPSSVPVPTADPFAPTATPDGAPATP